MSLSYQDTVVLAAWLLAQAGAPTPPAAPAPIVAECRLPGDADARVWRVEDRGAGERPRWWLTLSADSLGDRRVAAPLPGARVTRSPSALTLESVSGNGGLAVRVSAAAAGASLDVYVNYELEVNVWPDLSPDVEHMNTGGPRTDARCRLLPGPAHVP